MRRITNLRRVERLIRRAIDCMELNLSGISVLTEAASGNFAVTSLIAAASGASQVIALTRDSSFGSAAEVTKYVGDLAGALGVASRIEITTDRKAAAESGCSLVTNLGFVRPVNREIIARLPGDASISLMWEPWEFRAEDIDIEACRESDIPVVGTRESDPRVATLHYLGSLAIKLLNEAEIEIFGSRILVVGEPPFLEPTVNALKAQDAVVRAESFSQGWSGTSHGTEEFLADCDAVVAVDHCNGRSVIGGKDGISPKLLASFGVSVVHICGALDDEALELAGIRKTPARRVRPGYMTVTTDYVGPRPVIDLHAAGLRVGEIIVRARRSGLSADQSVERAVASGLALPLVLP